MDVGAVSRFLAVLALVAGPGGLLVAALRRHALVAPLRQHALSAAAAIAVTATAGSLYFSEVAGFIPCELCWWQRVAMYPLALLLPVAAVRRDRGVRPYVWLLAVPGLAVSLWHVAVQRIPALSGATSCAADAPCTTQWVDALGLSIPAMAACGFIGILALTTLPADDLDGSSPDPAGSGTADRPDHADDHDHDHDHEKVSP